MGVLGKGKDEEGAQSNSRKNRKLKKKTADFTLVRLNYDWKKKKENTFAIIIYLRDGITIQQFYVTVVVAAN